MASEEIVLPMQYDEVGVVNARKGEAYAAQVIRQGYPASSRDALATMAAIVFAVAERAETERVAGERLF